jgi:hypothetical protein
MLNAGASSYFLRAALTDTINRTHFHLAGAKASWFHAR